MTPGSHEQFRQLIDERLTAGANTPEAPQLRAHLQTCAACRDYLDTTLRAISALNAFSFPVDNTRPAAVTAALRLRSQQLTHRRLSWRTVALASLAALALTLAGAFIDLRLSGLLATVFDLQRAEVQHGLLTFWISPSLCLLLLFPLLPFLGRRTQGAL